MASADFWRPISAALATPSTRQVSRSPRVRRATFSPHTRRIYAGAIRMTSDFGSSCPLVHRVDASYALRVPRAGDLPRASFRLRLAADALALWLVVPVITVHRGLSPPSRFPGRFPSPVAIARTPALALRAMPGAQKRRPRSGRTAPGSPGASRGGFATQERGSDALALGPEADVAGRQAGVGVGDAVAAADRLVDAQTVALVVDLGRRQLAAAFLLGVLDRVDLVEELVELRGGRGRGVGGEGRDGQHGQGEDENGRKDLAHGKGSLVLDSTSGKVMDPAGKRWTHLCWPAQ